MRIHDPYETYRFSIYMIHTDCWSVFKEKVKGILALSPMLLVSQQKYGCPK